MPDYTELTDKELTTLLRSTHAEGHAAFTEIYNRYWQMAYRSAYNILDDEEACMDVLQDVFVWLWKNHEGQNINSIKAYLLTAVKFKMLNVIRQGKLKEKAYTIALPDEADPADLQSDLEVKELMRMIDDFTDKLPSQAQQIFRLSRYEQLSNKEIAIKMGLSEKTVKNQLNISLKKLKTTMGRMSFWCTILQIKKYFHWAWAQSLFHVPIRTTW